MCRGTQPPSRAMAATAQSHGALGIGPAFASLDGSFLSVEIVVLLFGSWVRTMAVLDHSSLYPIKLEMSR